MSNENPKCPTCQEVSIQNYAAGKPFFFCQKCRTEVDEKAPELQKYNDWGNYVTPHFPPIYGTGDSYD